jgi:hypothetical protein
VRGKKNRLHACKTFIFIVLSDSILNVISASMFTANKDGKTEREREILLKFYERWFAYDDKHEKNEKRERERD